jgi:hypothetical protein
MQKTSEEKPIGGGAIIATSSGIWLFLVYFS